MFAVADREGANRRRCATAAEREPCERESWAKDAAEHAARESATPHANNPHAFAHDE